MPREENPIRDPGEQGAYVAGMILAQAPSFYDGGMPPKLCHRTVPLHE
jgi:hypothetical protein